MGSKRGWYIAGAIVLAGAVLGTVAFRQELFSQQLASGNGKSQAPQASQAFSTVVQIATAQSGSIAQTLSYTGDVRAKNQVAVVPKLAGRIEKLEVDVGDRVEPGQRLATLDHELLDAQVQQAQAGVAAAQAKLEGMMAGTRSEQIAQLQANVEIVNQKLMTLQNGPRPEAVGQAQASLRASQAKLDQLKAGPTQAQIDAAEAAVRAAKNSLAAVEANADSLMSRMGSGYTPEMKAAQAGAAYEQVQVAEAQLAALKAPPTREVLDQAQSAVDASAQQLALVQSPFTEQDIKQAESAVRAAEQQLKLAQDPFTRHDLDGARALVGQAQAALQLATVQQKNAFVEAPISGVIADRFLSIGDMASPAAPMLTILGNGMEVQVAAEEAMVSQVSAGRPVSVTVAAYPGKSFSGKVTTVSPSLDPRTRTFTAKIEVDDQESLLKPGMFAQVTVVAASRDSVLLIPKKALVQRDQRQLVFVFSNGTASMKLVQTGLTDGKNVEITSGLNAGDRVILTNLADLADGDPVQVQGAGQ